MELILQVFYSVFSGCLLSAAIPNEIYLFGCPFFTLLAFIPFYLVFQNAKNYRQAFLFGFLQTITTHLISSFWLAYFKNFAIFTLGASAIGTGFIGGFFGLFFYLPYADSDCHNKLLDNSLVLKIKKTITFRILYFASLYTVYEWVKSSGFLGYPWGTVSSAIFNWPVIMQLSSITGTYGITFYITFLNGLFAEVMLTYFNNHKNKIPYIKLAANLAAVITLLIITHGVYQYNKVRKPEKILTSILVQQNSNPWNQKTDDNSILLSQQLTKQQLYESENNNKKVDLVVWSEGCLKRYFPDAENYYRVFPTESPLANFIQDCSTPFLLGGANVKDRATLKFNNAALMYDADGNYRGYYGKNHLVPFAETLPFIEYPKIRAAIQKIIGISAGWTPGDQYVYFDIPCKTTDDYKLPAVKDINLNQDYSVQKSIENKSETVRITTPICFDDSFTDIMRPMFNNGAELFINITDDSWSQKKSSETQHFVIASYRAIEYRTTLVRSANAGYSVVVTPAGKIIADMPMFEECAITVDVPVYGRTVTTYARFGNWLPYTLVILFFVFCFTSYINFTPTDYIPSERKIKKHHKKHSKKDKKKNSKSKK